MANKLIYKVSYKNNPTNLKDKFIQFEQGLGKQVKSIIQSAQSMFEPEFTEVEHTIVTHELIWDNQECIYVIQSLN